MTEAQALFNFKNSMDYPYYLKSWQGDDPCNGWSGITCTNGMFNWLSNLNTKNNDGSKPTLGNSKPLKIQDPDFKHYIFDYIKARASVRVKSTLRLLNKEMNNLLQSSLTEVHINYEHLQKLSESNFKGIVKIIKVTINNQNRKYTKNNEQVYYDFYGGIYIQGDALKFLSPKMFKNLKVAKVIIDKSIDNLGFNDSYMCLNVPLDESLCLNGLRVVNQSTFCDSLNIYGKNFKDFQLEISNSQFQGIGVQCVRCKLHVHDIKIINKSNSSEVGGIATVDCTQSIIEGISIEGVVDSGVYATKCDAIQLRNISIKNCSQIDGHAISFEKCQNLDIQNILVCQSKIELKFIESSGCIQDSVIETSTHGIVLKNSQIRNIQFLV